MAAYTTQDNSEVCDVIDIVPTEEYDSHRAKLKASLSWLLSKVYGSSIPRELQDPFYESAEGQLVLRPVLVNLMSSSELYCQACSNMFPDTHTQWQGHWSIIQVLSRKGIYISEIQETAVTETVLVQTAPFRLKAHLALIDALMKAYTCEVASIEKVVKAVRRITTFPASSELPGTPEEALIFWINKVCTVLETEEKSEEALEGIAGPKSRVSRKASLYHEPVQVPLLEDLMRDIGDGCSVAAVIAYYRPHLVNIKDLCLKEGIGIADSLHNLCQIGQFCRDHLPCKIFCFAYEDLLYAHDIMKINILAFLADLFYYFEGPNSCEGLGSSKSSSVDTVPAAGKKSSQHVHPSTAVSKVRGFHRQGFEETANNLGMGGIHQTLLPKRISGRHCIPQEEGGISASSSGRRLMGRRAMSLSTTQDRDIVQRSVLAWQDDQRIHRRSDGHVAGSSGQSRPQSHVSTDSALNKNYNNASTGLSLDLSGLDTSCNIALESSHMDYLELESVTPGKAGHTSPAQVTDRLGRRTPSTINTEQRLEPLLPALLKPTKEKEVNVSKAEERGDRAPRRKKMTSPSEIQLHPASQRSTTPLSQQRQNHLEDEEAMSARSDVTLVSPLPPVSGRSISPLPKLPQSLAGRDRVFDAFVIGADAERLVLLEPTMSNQGSPRRASQSDSDKDISTAGSYTVKDRASSAQAARAAGIPVVSDSCDVTLTSDRSREGSIASSGEYSDHESQKIHQEYKMRESGIVTTPDKVISTNTNYSNSKPVMLISDNQSNVKSKCNGDSGNILSMLSSNTTNFAELKRLKDQLGYNLDKMDRSALIYMQSGSQGGPYDKMSGLDLKTTFALKQGQSQQPGKDGSDKSGTNGQQTQISNPTVVPDNATLESNDANPGSLEMQQLRLKLEQKRKDIERKKHRQEAQQNKMRQQLGKAAFMRVVSKHIDGVEGESVDQVDASRLDNSPQAQIQARLGHPAQKLPLVGTPTHSHPLQTALGQGSQNTVIPADASAQRFTDWRSQSQLSRGGGGNSSTLGTIGNQPKKADQNQQFLMMRAGAVGGSDAASDYSPGSSQTSGNRAFSREGFQQTIDTVRNNWFKNESNLITGEGGASEDEDADGGSFRLHGDGDLLVGARARGIQDHSVTPSRSHSQSPLQGASQFTPTQFIDRITPVPPQEAAFPNSITDIEYQAYDSSLDKLNSSLTELQGEIMRLSLQHEQLKAAQSPVGGQTGRFSPRINDSLNTVSPAVAGTPLTQSRPINGIPQQGPYIQGVMTKQGIPLSSRQQHPLPTTSVPQDTTSQDINSLLSNASDISPQNISALESSSTPDQPRQNISESDETMNLSGDGFFVSFGDNTTPKRLKPKMTEYRTRGASPAPTTGQAPPPSTVKVISEAAGVSSDVAANLAGQAIVATLTPQRNDGLIEESSPNIGFVIQEESPAAKENVPEDEMQKKKIKLMEMQRKRKEEQEKKRLEKEAELAKKQEEKQLKEEEAERKKAEEKARRDLIFQQYLQKKQEEEETPVKPQPKRRDASASKQRPKSMFVKSKAMTPEPGSLAPDSGSSSQEDLTGRANMSGRSTPSVMSGYPRLRTSCQVHNGMSLRSSFHFRLPPPGHIRKAVSCNTLQGATNGVQGPTTYRRPASPELNRSKQRQKSTGQESANETGAVSFHGAEYAGPKLFVKPSAKSNRHIIVNAISHCCLAGSVNTDLKNKVLEEMSKCDANHFLILFRDAGCQYRGLFILYPETEEAFKVHGVGPKHIINAMCEKFYKYNSGAKNFSEITTTKHLSVSVDAVVLHTAVWKSVKAVGKR